jgi:methionine sulfoxide reductase heme-binding subunit
MILWYLARAAGVAAFASLSLATGLGALTARRTADEPGADRARAVERRVVWQYAHRAAALVGVALIGLHIGTLLADSYADVGRFGLLPFGSGYRPLAVTFGVLAAYLLVAVVVTGLLRGRMARSAAGARRWRYFHVTAYLAWAASACHFLLAGTDAGIWWALVVLFAGTAVVTGGLTARLIGLGHGAPRRPVDGLDAHSPLVRAQNPNLVGASR